MLYSNFIALYSQCHPYEKKNSYGNYNMFCLTNLFYFPGEYMPSNVTCPFLSLSPTLFLSFSFSVPLYLFLFLTLFL